MNNATAEAPVIAAFRDICDSCPGTPTTASLGHRSFRAKHMDRELSMEARYGLLLGSETIGKGLVTVKTDAGLDRKVMEFFEIIPGRVQSRVTNGGRDLKTSCFFDTQGLDTKSYEKYTNTEILYIHRSFCMKNFVGTILQGNSAQSNGLPVFIGGSDSLSDISSNNDLATELFMYDAHSFYRSIDGNNILGNFTGEGKDLGDGSALAQFPHYDGIIKQVMQNYGGIFYPEVDIELPALAAGQMYWMTWGGNTSCYATAEELVEALNKACIDTTGDFPFSASYTDPTLNIIGTIPTSEVYGTFTGLQIFVSETLDGCNVALPATVVQCPMDYIENGVICDFNEVLDCDNFFEYFMDKLKTINKHCLNLTQNGSAPNLGYAPIVIDPLKLVDMEVGEILRMCKCFNADNQTNRMRDYMPDFVGVEVLKGTGLWYWGPVSNFIFLTTMDDQRLANFETGYEAKCGEVWSKMNVAAGMLVKDFGKTATNAKNSPFHKKLLPPQVPANLPHNCPDLRKDCVTPFCGGTVSPTATRAGFKAVVEPMDDGTCTLYLSDASICPPGIDIASVLWTINLAVGAPLTSTDLGDLEQALTAEQCATLISVEYEVTLTDGTVKSTKQPITEGRMH